MTFQSLFEALYSLYISWLPAPYQVVINTFLVIIAILLVFRIIKIVLDALPVL